MYIAKYLIYMYLTLVIPTDRYIGSRHLCDCHKSIYQSGHFRIYHVNGRSNKKVNVYIHNISYFIFNINSILNKFNLEFWFSYFCIVFNFILSSLFLCFALCILFMSLIYSILIFCVHVLFYKFYDINYLKLRIDSWPICETTTIN